jgi:putative ABC transport system permease protein
MFSQSVKSIGWASAAPGDEIIQLGLRPRISIEGVIDSAELKLVSVDENFFNTLSVELIAGRNFDPAIATDRDAVILNESAARMLGFDNVEDVVGRSISGIREKRSNVIGLIRNYHQRSLKNKFESIVFTPSWENDLGWNNRYYFVKLDKHHLATYGIDSVIQDLQRAWNESTPDHPFHYFFLDTSFESEYKSDVSVGRLFVFFSAFAVFIACLGLFGLVSYITIQRTKEIGVRKILGASVNNILVLISGDFVRLMVIATLLATPGSWYLFDRWLESYAFRIDVNTALLLTPVFMLVTLSLITVMLRSYRVANANPIDSIRHE